MATITTKYAIGDTVWHAGTTTERRKHPCPDCKGERKWSVKSPAGGEYEIPCPRCTGQYLSNSGLSLDYTVHTACVGKLTIGSVQYNSHPKAFDHGARYMCHETGVGSGSVYDEGRLFATEEEARAAAEVMAEEANAKTPWIVELYNKSLEISDYQLDNATVKLAKDQESRARVMLWNISDLFEQIKEADDKDAVLEVIDDYQKYSWDRDKEALKAREGGQS